MFLSGVGTLHVLPSALSIVTQIFQIFIQKLLISAMQKAHTVQAVADAYRCTPMASHQFLFIEGGTESVNINRRPLYTWCSQDNMVLWYFIDPLQIKRDTQKQSFTPTERRREMNFDFVKKKTLLFKVHVHSVLL